KLARRPATEAELAIEPTDKVKVLLETRGEGGFVVIAPTPGTHHPSGRPWTALLGNPDTVPVISTEQRDLLHAVATLFDVMPPPPAYGGADPPTSSAARNGGLRPGDDFNARADWSDI